MEKRYEQYCLADPLFYDSPYCDEGGTTAFAVVSRPLPAGWKADRVGEWQANIPPGASLPLQGWKVHVSACLDNAEDVITRVWDYCVRRETAFKYLPGRRAVLMRNAKYAPRGSSGKVVTIYPADDDEFELVLKELDEALAGEEGPYILSDLKYGNGPLYVRYGGFTQRFCLDAQDDMTLAIENAAGELVPDLRGPVFAVPPWVSLPGFLTPHLAARNATTMAGLPYVVEQALHFSNGGGVYTGTDKRTGERVVLKEARPHAGLAADGSDAVTRLAREYSVLRKLAGLGIAPAPHGCFEVGGHHFLAQEFIEGTSLNSCYADRFPLLDAGPDPVKTRDYTSWALHICDEIERAVQAAHSRGVILNDLHMFNIIVRPDDTVALIDFEAATGVSEGRRPTVGNPGFMAPRDRTGFGIDAYSMACIRLALFMPLTTLFSLDPYKAQHIAGVIGEHFDVPAEFLSGAVREITRPAGGPGGRRPPAAVPCTPPEYRDFGAGERAWDLLRPALAAAITASATPSRDDRLFPGDIDQFAAPGGGLGLAHGAAGVLYALSEAAGVRTPEHEEWLIARAADPPRGTKAGLYDGLAGVAFVLCRLGHKAAALRAAELCLSGRWERLGYDLHGGLPGLALALLSLADGTGERALADAAHRAAGMVAGSITADAPARARGAAGLLHGAAGRALMCIRLYERTADPGYLDAAATALAADLDRCVTDRKGSLQVDDGWRTLPYLRGGSTGIGLVAELFLAHRDNARFAEALAPISLAARSCFYAQPGLFSGRAGMLLYLAGRASRAAARPGRPEGGPGPAPAADSAGPAGAGPGGAADSAGPAGAGPGGAADSAGTAGPGTGGAAADGDTGAIAAHVRRLAWHAIPYGGGLAFPGDMLFRLSMDLATGTAGVLLALAAAQPGAAPVLPFLGPPAVPARAGDPGAAVGRPTEDLPGGHSPYRGAHEDRYR